MLEHRNSKSTKSVNKLIGLILFFIAGSVHAQILVAVDDSYGVPSNVLSSEPFIVEDPGGYTVEFFSWQKTP